MNLGKKIKALVSFDRRLILKTFSAELHKATTELLGYQWLIIYLLSLGFGFVYENIKKTTQNLNTLAKFQHKYPKGPFLAEIGILSSFIVSLKFVKKTAKIYTKDHFYYNAKSAAFLTGIPMKFRKNSVNSDIYSTDLKIDYL